MENEMSTYRYSGQIRIRITYIDFDAGNRYNMDGSIRFPNGSYRCFLRSDTGFTTIVIVGAPAFLSQAVDSPEAFDEVARAAISFAAHDGSDHEEDDKCDWAEICDYGTDMHIGRTKKNAWVKR